MSRMPSVRAALQGRQSIAIEQSAEAFEQIGHDSERELGSWRI